MYSVIVSLPRVEQWQRSGFLGPVPRSYASFLKQELLRAAGQSSTSRWMVRVAVKLQVRVVLYFVAFSTDD